jgi:DNA repair protein RadC
MSNLCDPPCGTPKTTLDHCAKSHSRQECDPSKENIDTTNKITQALKYVGVRVRQDFFSFAKAGLA